MNTVNLCTLPHILLLVRTLRRSLLASCATSAQQKRFSILFSSTSSPIFFSSHTSTFHLLDKTWSQVSSLLPPGSWIHFSSSIGFSNPTARRFSVDCKLVAHSRSRTFRKSTCAQGKVLMIFYECALEGIRPHEADLYQARRQPDTPPGIINSPWPYALSTYYLYVPVSIIISFRALLTQ